MTFCVKSYFRGHDTMDMTPWMGHERFTTPPFLYTSQTNTISFFSKNCIYLFLERGEGWRKRGRETLLCERDINWLPLACPQLGTWPATQTWRGTEPAILWFTGQHSVHWATPARAQSSFCSSRATKIALASMIFWLSKPRDISQNSPHSQ